MEQSLLIHGSAAARLATVSKSALFSDDDGDQPPCDVIRRGHGSELWTDLPRTRITDRRGRGQGDSRRRLCESRRSGTESNLTERLYRRGRVSQGFISHRLRDRFRGRKRSALRQVRTLVGRATLVPALGNNPSIRRLVMRGNHRQRVLAFSLDPISSCQASAGVEVVVSRRLPCAASKGSPPRHTPQTSDSALLMQWPTAFIRLFPAARLRA